MEGPENLDKAAWTKEMLHVFCDLCIKAIDMGMKPNTHFDKAGWKYLLTAFKEQTGHAFTKTQLKNKWDGCKKDWRIWTKLISEIGVGWSNELGTISASDEWWKAKIQEIKGAKKFRQAGIEPSLRMKFDRMFLNIVATGKYAWAPSSGVFYDDIVSPESFMMILLVLLRIQMPMRNNLTWKKEAVIQKRMEYQISLMMFATWLEGLICLAVATHASVGREKKEKVLKLGCNYYHGWIK